LLVSAIMQTKKSVRRKNAESQEPKRREQASPRKPGDRPGKGLDKSTEAVVQNRTPGTPARRRI
jgi:hypothetical protein